MTVDLHYLRELAEQAETPEQLAEVERLLQQVEGAPSRWTVPNLADVAEFFGLNLQTVKQWRTERPPMPGGAGGFPLNDIVAWRHAKLATSGVAEEKKQAELEATRLANEAKRIDLAQRRGEIVEIDEVERWASMAMIEAREMLMALPEMLVAACPPELRDYVREESDRHVRHVLSMLRRKLESNALASNQALGATGEDQDERMA